jgi:hypothetical protein
MLKLSEIIKFMGNRPIEPLLQPKNGPSLATLSLRETSMSRSGTGKA